VLRCVGVYSFIILLYCCLLVWWCCYFLGRFFCGWVLFCGWCCFWWMVFCVMLFLWCDGFWWFFGLGCFLDAVRFGDGFNFWGCGFLGLVSVPFLFRFLCFWMLWAVVFILGRWLVWWFGFYRVFGFLQSFASLYRFNFASFDVFLWVVNSSAVNVNGSYFYFFKGSWMDTAFELL